MAIEINLISIFWHVQVVHPILDQSFFFDAFHKMRLKEEFGIFALSSFIFFIWIKLVLSLNVITF